MLLSNCLFIRISLNKNHKIDSNYESNFLNTVIKCAIQFIKKSSTCAALKIDLYSTGLSKF